MKTKPSFLLAVALAFSFAQGACAQVRPADGEPCRANEKTYYDKDGSTPFQCEPQGGPAYAFKVFVDGKLAWQGVLRQDQREARKPMGEFEGSQPSPSEELVVGRCFDVDASGATVFFGRRYLSAIATYASAADKDGHQSVLSLPTFTNAGHCVGPLGIEKREGATFERAGPNGELIAYRIALRDM